MGAFARSGGLFGSFRAVLVIFFIIIALSCFNSGFVQAQNKSSKVWVESAKNNKLILWDELIKATPTLILVAKENCTPCTNQIVEFIKIKQNKPDYFSNFNLKVFWIDSAQTDLLKNIWLKELDFYLSTRKELGYVISESIEATPSLLLFCNKKFVFKSVGFLNSDALNLFLKHPDCQMP